MSYYPEIIQKLINAFNKLPNIGPKTSERFVFHLLDQPREEIEELISLLKNLREKISLCSNCFNYSEKDPCSICSNSQRNHSVICLVATPQDLTAIERTGEYRGVYHILGSTIDNLENNDTKKLRIKELIERIKKNKPPVLEIIFAFNPDINGETTILYLNKILKEFKNKIKFTRLARGLPLGGHLEYADQITLINALRERKKLDFFN